MGRFFAPLLAFAAAGYVFWKNQGATAEFVFLFPINTFYDDPAVAGERSWQALVGIGVLWLAIDVVALIRERRAKASEAAQEG